MLRELKKNIEDTFQGLRVTSLVEIFYNTLKLALNDTIQDIKSFQMIKADENLLSLSEFTKKRGLKAFSEALAEAGPKPSKVYGAC